MHNKKKENSIKSLINLYTVVMGVALSMSITTLIDPQVGLTSVRMSALLLFTSFILTLLPFYHGALRHLDDAYIENASQQVKDGVLVFDFLLLLLHAMAFVVLSLLIQVPNHFAWLLCAVFLIDVIWAVFAHFGTTSDGENVAEWKWAVINFIFILVVVSYLVYNEIYFDPVTNPIGLAMLIMAASLIRTLVDYIWGKDFYFPKSNSE
ncbi:MAG: hypothetical protein V3V18_03995 [Methylococcales bacterium]